MSTVPSCSVLAARYALRCGAVRHLCNSFCFNTDSKLLDGTTKNSVRMGSDGPLAPRIQKFYNSARSYQLVKPGLQEHNFREPNTDQEKLAETEDDGEDENAAETDISPFCTLPSASGMRPTLTEMRERLIGHPLVELQRQHLAVQCPTCQKPVQSDSEQETNTPPGHLYGRLSQFADYVCVCCGAIAHNFDVLEHIMKDCSNAADYIIKETDYNRLKNSLIVNDYRSVIADRWNAAVSWSSLSETEKRNFRIFLMHYWRLASHQEKLLDCILDDLDENGSAIRFAIGDGKHTVILPRYRIIPGNEATDLPSGLELIHWNGKKRQLPVEIIPNEPCYTYLHGFYGGETVNDSSGKVQIVASEFDALVLRKCSHQKPIQTIVLPESDAIDVYSRACLTEFSRITFWYSSSNAESAKRIAHSLDSSRTAFISSADSPGDLWIKGVLQSEILRRLAKWKMVREVKTVTSMYDNRQLAYVACSTREQRKAGIAQWQRYHVLNKYLCGFRPGEITILTGQTGTGKTTFLCDYMRDLLPQGVLTLFCSFEMRNIDIIDVLNLQNSGGRVLERSLREEELSCHTDLMTRTTDNLLLLESHKLLHLDTREVFKFLETQVIRAGINHLIIDNLQFLVNNASEKQNWNSSSFDRFLQQDFLLRSIRRFTTETGCHVTIVVHPRKEQNALVLQSIGGSPTVTQEADNVLVIQREYDDQCDETRRYLHILKNRFVGKTVHSNKIELVYNSKSRQYTAIEVPLNVKPPFANNAFRSAQAQKKHNFYNNNTNWAAN